MSRRIVILTEGRTQPISAKTAVSLLRYVPEEVVALIDSEVAGRTTGEVLGHGGDTPILASLNGEVEADTLVIGVATAGGILPESMEVAVVEAIKRGMTVINGLHQFLNDDTTFRVLAKEHGAKLIDLRRNAHRSVADREGIDETCYRVQTVGNDCSVGKMLSAFELATGLKDAGLDAKFVATGQTGILLEGDGIPMDAVIADFINGAAEQLVKDHQRHDILVLEGQATLAHPAYSSVTLGLLHGSMPDGLVLCYEADRPHMIGRPTWPIPPVEAMIPLYEQVGSIMNPCKVIAVAINGRRLEDDAAFEQEKQRVESLTGLPVCDVVREGTDTLVQAVQNHRRAIGKTRG